LVILCDTGSHLKEKINKRGGRGNSSSKALGISFADRPKAKRFDVKGQRSNGKGQTKGEDRNSKLNERDIFATDTFHNLL
jgi:hypothetical protein